jgi:hypothetical protein
MKFVDLQGARILIVCIAAAILALIIGYVGHAPDISLSDAAGIISRAPEFNRYARLVEVESIYPQKDSMAGVAFGKFTFLYLNAPINSPLMEADVDFRYHEGQWYLNQFDYGCPTDCHSVEVHDGPDKHTRRGRP